MIAPLYWSLVGFLLLASIVLITILADNAFDRKRGPWIPYAIRVPLYGVYFLVVATVIVLILAVRPI